MPAFNPEGIYEDISELKVGQARVETRVDNIEQSIEKVGTSLVLLGGKVDEIHGSVVKRSTDVAWLKKIVMMVLAAIIGTSAVGVGTYKALSDEVKTEITKEAAANGVDHNRDEENRSDRERPE